MAKSSRPSRTGPSGRTHKTDNVSGYAKRHARKAKGVQSSDVYEYAPEKVKRSKVKLDLDRDEETGFDVRDEDMEDRERLRARLIGENGDDEMIDSADDEEIDSDAAFEESDEDRFAGFFSTKNKSKRRATKKKSSVRFAEVDLNEDNDMEGPAEEAGSEDEDMKEEEEEGEDDEFIDVLDILDGRGEPDNGSDTEDHVGPASPSKSKMQVDEDDSNEEEEEEVDSGSDSDDQDAFAPSDEDSAPDALDGLHDFISTLDTTAQKRKLPADDRTSRDNAERPRKRRMLKERTETGAENEFRAQPSDGMLKLDDLLAPLASQSSNLLSLKKSAKTLASSSKTRTLAAPLPQRTQERLDREAAYEQTKEEVDKWKATMTRIKEAEHLSFPLQAKPAGRVSNLELAAKFKPTTELESSVDALLKSAKLREEDIQQTEENMLQMNDVPVEEVATRRAELRKMRELMFRADVKAKRAAKIKSKTYRKIKRKEKERLGEKLDAGESETEEGKMQREVDRAKERATLRHKNTGKWAKHMKGREEGRKDIEEMLDRGERLRRKIVGKDTDESEDEDSEAEDFDAEAGVERIKRNAFDQLQQMKVDDAVEPTGKGSKIFEMKFMKDALARQQQGANRLVDDFIKEIGDQASEGVDAEGKEEETSGGVLVARTGGRMMYRPGVSSNLPAHASTSKVISNDSSEAVSAVNNISPPPSPPPKKSRLSTAVTETEESNPWLASREAESSTKAPRKKNEVVVGKDSKAQDKSKNKLKKQAKRTEGEKEKMQADAEVEISMDNVLTLGPSSSTSAQAMQKGKKPVKPTDSAVVDGDVDSDANSEVDEQEMLLDLKGKGKARGVKAFEQRDLVALAFAGDNVVRDFEDVKRREIAADAPKEIDTTIPGWGSWAGAGMKQRPPKARFMKKVAGVDPTSRADFGKSHVIISEKRDKKAGKYLVKDLPYPYTSAAQFERRMEQPLGVEWNTRIGFQRGTLPKVVKKMGTIIDPLEKLF